MPSAANVKVEKTAPNTTGSDNGLVDNTNVTPMRQAITVVEHKIRNLEKRKAKLESYRDLQKSGKDLNADQKTAIAKYDEVVQTLEFARDLNKQFLGIALVTEKEDKKKARKDALARSQAELNKVREVLLIQDALTSMGNDTMREDFLNGRNGAASLSSADIKLLDDYYAVVTPKHETGDPTGFRPQVQAAAEHLLAVVDGKNKEVFGSTYGNIKEVIGKVHESGYLDQSLDAFEEPVTAAEVAPLAIAEVIPEPTTLPVNEASMLPTALPLEPQPVQPPTALVNASPMPMEVQSMPEQPPAIFFAAQPPQTRPITDVIGTGSFFFLQESELDTPPEQITSQTFTNQNFVGAPPPPIPMPPHFAQFPTTQTPPQPVVVVAQAQVSVNQAQQIPQQQQQPQQIGLSVANKNGFGDQNEPHEEVIRHRGGGNRHQQQQQRSNITSQHPQPQQTFFANNNGFANRPNRARNNAPRLNSNRQTN